MEPFYFGEAERRLFGVYHPPHAGRERDVGVVLCYPLGQEHLRSHRAFLRLAVALADAGFHVLRFDLAGCGDSQDPAATPDLASWSGDLRTAARELRGGSGATRLCLAGLRLGASLVASGADGDEVDAAALWDPIVDGRAYLDELAERHRAYLRGTFARGAPAANGSEALGFALAPELVASLGTLDLLKLEQSPARHVLLLDTGEKPSLRSLCAHLEALGAQSEHLHRPAPAVWVKQDDALGSAPVPSGVLEALVSWLEGTCA